MNETEKQSSNLRDLKHDALVQEIAAGILKLSPKALAGAAEVLAVGRGYMELDAMFEELERIGE